ncbi:MAG: CaiB/BaiF CoA-transferase family protein [Acidimicrobiales bacterium]|nr:CaiB/BaiF CoA-transferase family protein [Acidimicrobiales bacterium]
MDDRPLLEGVTVLVLASVGPAARAARWLADWGATVVEVGPIPRDRDLQITPPAHAYAAHRGMRRIMVDLQAENGRDAFLRLAAKADVVIESFRPGVVDRLGVGYEAVRVLNPGIVYCSTTGYGQTGPRSSWAGHDLNYLAVGGYLHCSGRDERGGPALPGATVADSAAGGLHAVAAVCAALVARAATGEGVHLDVSVADGVLALMSLAIDEHLAEGVQPGPREGLLTGRYAWYDLYQAGDGGWLAVAAIEPKFFANLCHILGCEQWIDRQYNDDVETMRADFTAAFASRSRDDWVAELAPADACVSPVLDVPGVVADGQYGARGAFVEVTHPTSGRLRQVGAPLARQVDPVVLEIPDWTATATEELLDQVGVAPDTVTAWRAAGVIA